MNIKNKNFISSKMQIVDIKHAFGVETKGIQKFIYDELIGPGFLRKINGRYYAPTEKLLDLAWLPPMLDLTEYQARFLSYNSHFSRPDLIELLDDNIQIVKQLVKFGFFMLQKNGSYSKSAKLEEALADGETQFSLTPITQ